jgi:putative transposon-encoded protein
LRQREGNRVSLKKEAGLKEISGTPEGYGNFVKAKIRVFGEEMIEKEVKPRGNSGRVYLPPDWVGKIVKIIRID